MSRQRDLKRAGKLPDDPYVREIVGHWMRGIEQAYVVLLQRERELRLYELSAPSLQIMNGKANTSDHEHLQRSLAAKVVRHSPDSSREHDL